MKYKVSVIFVLLGTIVSSVTAENFNEYLFEQNTSYLKDDAFFEKNLIKENKEFNIYRKKILKAFSLYKKKVSLIWGENNTVVSTKSIWAEYQENMQQRHIVDFEKGLVTVEVILESNTAKSKKSIQNKLNNALINSLSATADTRSIIKMVNSPVKKKLKNKNLTPVLKNMVKDKNGNVITSQNAKTFAEKITRKSIKLNKVKGQDGVKRIVASASYKLVPNHIRKRAERFRPLVRKYSKKHELSQNLIYAVIETESFFNPVARSNAPAYGLMQLVPHYGAREAYRYLFKKDKIVSASYLYDANNNIKLGSAYFHVLFKQHMSGIRNKQSRLWSAIAAYNTGPSNVFRAVAGKYRRSVHRRYKNWKNNAIRKINKMSPEQLYAVLRKNLPYPETRNYIQKVRSRMGKYSSF